MKRVEVEWVDSMSEGRWTDVDSAIRNATYDVMRHRTLGYLVHETDDLILVAGSRGEDGSNVSDTMQIPKVAVLSVRQVRF